MMAMRGGLPEADRYGFKLASRRAAALMALGLVGWVVLASGLGYGRLLLLPLVLITVPLAIRRARVACQTYREYRQQTQSVSKIRATANLAVAVAALASLALAIVLLTVLFSLAPRL